MRFKQFLTDLAIENIAFDDGFHLNQYGMIRSDRYEQCPIEYLASQRTGYRYTLDSAVRRLEITPLTALLIIMGAADNFLPFRWWRPRLLAACGIPPVKEGSPGVRRTNETTKVGV